MGKESSIEWTDSTWNPVTGCDKVSPGCKNCYAETFAERWRGTPGHPYEQGFDLKLWESRLDIPLRWTKPRKVFVNSMSDLFHKDIPLEFIKKVFDVMNRAHWHTFQVLTKRSERLFELNEQLTWTPNIWMGVSVESQDYTDRIIDLRYTDAHVKFISAEPLLGPIDFSSDLFRPLNGIDWVIVGGESGRGARRMDPAWAESILKQCKENGVAAFFKQTGSVLAKEWKLNATKGGDYHELPEALQIRQMPLPKVK